MAAMVGDVTDAGAPGDGSFLDLDELIEVEQDERRVLARKLVELNRQRTTAEITDEEFNRRKAKLYGTS